MALRWGSGPGPNASRSVSPSSSSTTAYADSVVLAEIVDRHDVGVRQRGDGLASRSKRASASGLAPSASGSTLIATSRSETLVVGAVDLTHPAAPG